MHEKVEIDICHLTKFWLKAFEPEIQLPSHFSVESMSGVGLSIGILFSGWYQELYDQVLWFILPLDGLDEDTKGAGNLHAVVEAAHEEFINFHSPYFGSLIKHG